MADPTVTVRIKGDKSGLDATLSGATSGVMGFARGVSQVASMVGAAFSINQIRQYATEMLRNADNTVIYARGIGESVKAVVALQQSAASFGQSGDKVLTWLQKLVDAQDKIKAGSGNELIRWLQQSKISVEAFTNASPAKALEMLMRGADGATASVGALNAMLGGGAASDAKEAFQDLAANGLDPLIAKYGALGTSIERLSTLNNKLEKLQAKGKAFMIEGWGREVEDVENYIYANNKKSAMFATAHPAIKASIAMAQIGFDRALYMMSFGKIDRGPGIVKPIDTPQPPPKEAPPDPRIDDLRAKQEKKDANARFRTQHDDMNFAQLKAVKARTEVEYRAALAAGNSYEKIVSLQTQLKLLDDILKEANKAFDEHNKAARELQDKQAAITEKITDLKADKTAIRVAAAKTAAETTMAMPQLTGIEAVGGLLGGSGGYALGAERLQREIKDLTKETNIKLAEIDDKIAKLNDEFRRTT